VVRGSVIVAHPGRQHSYEAALAMQEAGLLASYITGIYYKPESMCGRAVRLIGPAERGMRRRYQDGLACELVRQYPLGELLYLGASRLRPFARYAPGIVRWRNDRFDRFVGRVVERERPMGVICYDTCALQTFRKAGDLEVLRVLDQSVGHWRTLAAMMREEAALQPDFADSLPLKAPERFLAQCTEEALLADVILAGSQFVKDTMVRHGVEPSRVAVIPYGADIERFRPVRRAKDGRFRVLFVGQLSQRKGIKYLLEAVAALGIPGLELLLVGGVVGSGRGLAAYRGHFAHVSNVPHHEVQHHFQQADIFVYPSLYEGSAIAIYEALASGLPVVTTSNSGSVVRNGVEGFIVPIRDVETLKEKILLLYEDRELRAAMGTNARKRAEQFTWAAYRKKVGALLGSILIEKGLGDGRRPMHSKPAP
jgi:glycosyltransferase involved in cell wall biosynthesis